MELQAAAEGLSALGLANRLAVFRLLVKAGSAGVASGDIAQALGALPSTMSANLAVLSHAGLIRSRREGRSIIYTANFDAMRDLLAFLVEDCCCGSREICEPLADVALRAAACAPTPATH